MIAHAVSSGCGAANAKCRRLRAGFVFLALLIGATPAFAQWTGNVGLASDDRLRGYSLTYGHAAASAQINWDDPSGFYASLSGLVELGRDTRFLGVTANAGYAWRLSEKVTLDGGVLRSQIRPAAAGAYSFDYSEVYAGIYVGPIAGRLYYSPDKEGGLRSTVYGELEAGFEPLKHWRVNGHIGLMTHLHSSTIDHDSRSFGDWEVSLARQLGKVELHAALSNGRPDAQDNYQSKRKLHLVFGGSVAL